MMHVSTDDGTVRSQLERLQEQAREQVREASAETKRIEVQLVDAKNVLRERVKVAVLAGVEPRVLAEEDTGKSVGTIQTWARGEKVRSTAKGLIDDAVQLVKGDRDEQGEAESREEVAARATHPSGQGTVSTLPRAPVGE